jgi:hypothetical protein
MMQNNNFDSIKWWWMIWQWQENKNKNNKMNKLLVMYIKLIELNHIYQI